MNNDTLSPLGNVITIDDERIKSHLDRVVRGSVEETLNALLRTRAARRDTRAGHYERSATGWRGTAEGTEASPTDL